MAVGNAVGSNIFNILMVLGIICYQSGSFDPGKHNRYSASYGIFRLWSGSLQEIRKKLSARGYYNGGGISGFMRIYYCPLIKAEKAFSSIAKGEMKAFFDWKTGEN